MARTVQKLKRSVRLSDRLKLHLETLEEQDARPLNLIKWAERAFRIAKEENDNLKDVRHVIEKYARARNYTERQIYNALPKEVKGKQGPKNERTSIFSKSSLRKMITQLTGLDNSELLDLEPKHELAEETRTHRLDVISRWGKTEVEEATVEAIRLASVAKDLVEQLDEKRQLLSRPMVRE